MNTIILAGGGHGHINILKKLAEKAIPDFNIILISDFVRQYYSGMLPGFIEGIYSEDEMSFDIEYMCKRAGVKFINEKIVEINAISKEVVTMGNVYKYGFLSMNLGSASKEKFELIAEEGIYVKPISSIVKFKEMLDIAQIKYKNSFRQEGDIKKLVIVGGGASGTELAIALKTRYDNLSIQLITSEAELIPKFNKKSQKKLEDILRYNEIGFRSCERVEDISHNIISSESEQYIYDFVVISTGFTGSKVRFTGFETTEDNFILVDNNLRATDNVLAMGDMITIKGAENTPKAGVFAIRQAPVLYKNLLNLIRGKDKLRKYIPQKNFLQVINTGHETALINYADISISGKFAWKIKNYIDRSYMRI